MELKQISVMISSYKQLDYLKEALESVLGQSIPFYEILVVDDCSQDGTIEYLRAQEQIHDTLRVIELEENQGLSGSRNKGLKFLTGQYFIFLDGDDWLTTDAHETLQGMIADQDHDICVYDYVCIDDDTKQTFKLSDRSPHFSSAGLKNYAPKSPEDIAKVMQTSPQSWLFLHRRAFVEKEKLDFKSVIFEDFPWHFQCLALAKTIRCTDKELVHYRVHSKSLLRTSVNNHKELFEVFARTESFFNSSSATKPAYVEMFRWYRFSVLAFSLTIPNRYTEDVKPQIARNLLSIPTILDFVMADEERQKLQTVKKIAARGVV